MPIQFTCPHCGSETNVADEFAGQTGPCAKCGKTVTVPRAAAPPGYAAAAKRSSGVPIVAVLAVVGVVLFVCGGILLALLLPAVGAAREAARRVQCQNNLKQISLALLNYESTYGCFPPACITDDNGRPMHSWRVLILPYLEREDLYRQYDFDEPWDSPKNRMVTDAVISLYHCPSVPQTPGTETNYVMIVGPETVAFENSAVGMTEIVDGLSNTIMLVETADSGIGWAEPRDLSADDLSMQINDGSGEGIRSYHPGGVNASFCDGSVHFLSDSLDREALRRMINRKDGMPVDPAGF